MISSADVLRFSELKMMTAEASKTLRKLDAEKNEIERRLILAANEGQRVEGICPFRLQVNTEDKRYSPKYRDCAIELAGETAVTDWVIEHDPKETKEVLALIPKMAKQILVSKPVRAVMEALKAAAG